jgi:hypothetical protein
VCFSKSVFRDRSNCTRHSGKRASDCSLLPKSYGAVYDGNDEDYADVDAKNVGLHTPFAVIRCCILGDERDSAG